MLLFLTLKLQKSFLFYLKQIILKAWLQFELTHSHLWSFQHINFLRTLTLMIAGAEQIFLRELEFYLTKLFFLIKNEAMKRERLPRLLRTRSLLHSFCYFLISFECVCVERGEEVWRGGCVRQGQTGDIRMPQQWWSCKVHWHCSSGEWLPPLSLWRLSLWKYTKIWQPASVSLTL